MTGPLTGSPAIVDDAAKYLEQPGCAMNLANDDELSPLSAQEGIGIVKPPAIGRSLEVEVSRHFRDMLGVVKWLLAPWRPVGSARYANAPRSQGKW